MLIRLAFSPKKCFIFIVLVPVTIFLMTLYYSTFPVNTRGDSYMTNLNDFIRQDSDDYYFQKQDLKDINKIKKSNQELICALKKEIDPFSKSIINYMKDFGDIECQYSKFLYVNLVNSTVVNITAFGVYHLYNKHIIYDKEKKFQFSTQQNFIKTNTLLLKGYSGALRNKASNRCIIPVNTVENGESSLIFTTNCSAIEAVFTFEMNGLVRHKVTNMCIGVKKDQKIVNNVRLVITSNCTTSFDIIHENVIKIQNSEFCIHPLWGGVPSEGQELCLYNMCESRNNLKYSFWTSVADKKTSKLLPLQSEMNMLEVVFFDESRATFFLLSIQPKDLPLPKLFLQPNIFMITIDEASAAHLQRKLKLSYRFIFEEMKSIFYKGYTPISKQTEQNLFAMLSGSINGSTEDLFSIANSLHYATLFSYDDPFQISSHAHHSSLPLFHALKHKTDVVMHDYCIATMPAFKPSIDYLYSFIDAYPNNPKFASIVFSLITQSNFNALSYLDSALEKLLKDLKKLNNTIIVINTVKGSLVGKLAELPQGLLENKSPFLSIYFSEDIQVNYNMALSRQKDITTPFDLHVTLKSFLSTNKYEHPYGVSLYENAAPRSCVKAGIHSSMCPCN
ncbi:uncharacterized protein LOC100215005 isoform X1 [Hydra vulgaris]|uniref:uncharacterized protein LOC100215005 isoform X1 n=1 Tax=Hydra vulgaris TaxID=6087 RepID=UPI0032EA0068